MLTEAIKQKIKLAVEAGRSPKRSKGGSYILRFGANGFKYLVRDGEATEAGLHWATLTGEALPTDGFDRNQKPSREGGQTTSTQTVSKER